MRFFYTMNDETKENLIAAIVVLALFLAIGWWLYSQISAPVQQEELVDIKLGTSPSLGDANAPITVVEFSDFECPFCGQFQRDQFSSIKEQFIDTGKVRFVFKHFPLSNLHEHALSAAEAAHCAHAQGKFWEYHDLLYKNQNALNNDDLKRYAADIGLNQDIFNGCFDQHLMQAEVLRDRRQGEEAGVTGTPTFFINGKRVVGAMSAEDFSREIGQDS